MQRLIWFLVAEWSLDYEVIRVAGVGAYKVGRVLLQSSSCKKAILRLEIVRDNVLRIMITLIEHLLDMIDLLDSKYCRPNM